MSAFVNTNHYKYKEDSNKKDKPRVVLLLDLDCFYAQCETVRLNLPQSLPVCLLQWNSALAVNYPAREYGIKRGDGFEEIQKKGKGKVIALHLPVLPIEETDTDANLDQRVEDDAHLQQKEEPTSLDELYDQEFRLPPKEQALIYEKEKNVMRRPEEGKASLDRYRLASNRIFSVILECLQELTVDKKGEGTNKNANGKNYILEKASIDELFVDVTDYCYHSICNTDDLDRIKGLQATKETTLVVHPNTKYSPSFRSWDQKFEDDDDDDESTKHEAALWQGCYVAEYIRKNVFKRLGFTLSAGISMNKLMAKLGAGYGKPNGQAIILESSIAKVMEETKIRKVRNLGGKLGKLIQGILPPHSEKVSCIHQNLSLPQLIDHLKSRETATFVYNSSRGICHEPVKATHKVLNKSITSFKSFPKAHNFTDLKPYVQLLNKDLVKRVLFDFKYNERWPKSCSVQYTYVNMKSCEINVGTERNKKAQRKSVRDHRYANELYSKSIRIPFPHYDLFHRNNNSKFEQIFLEQLLKMIENKLSHCYPMCRIGLSAIEFEMLCVKKGIDSFFKASMELNNFKREDYGKIEISSPVKVEVHESSPSRNQQNANTHSSNQIQEHISSSTVGVKTNNGSSNVKDICTDYTSHMKESIVEGPDPDLVYAQKLQASFDRESKVISAMEKKTNKRKNSVQCNSINKYFSKVARKPVGIPTKKMNNLDNYFPKRFA